MLSLCTRKRTNVLYFPRTHYTPHTDHHPIAFQHTTRLYLWKILPHLTLIYWKENGLPQVIFLLKDIKMHSTTSRFSKTSKICKIIHTEMKRKKRSLHAFAQYNINHRITYYLLLFSPRSGKLKNKGKKSVNANRIYTLNGAVS